jgi:hypothetical protein
MLLHFGDLKLLLDAPRRKTQRLHLTTIWLDLDTETGLRELLVQRNALEYFRRYILPLRAIFSEVYDVLDAETPSRETVDWVRKQLLAYYHYLVRGFLAHLLFAVFNRSVPQLPVYDEVRFRIEAKAGTRIILPSSDALLKVYHWTTLYGVFGDRAEGLHEEVSEVFRTVLDYQRFLETVCRQRRDPKRIRRFYGAVFPAYTLFHVSGYCVNVVEPYRFSAVRDL